MLVVRAGALFAAVLFAAVLFAGARFAGARFVGAFFAAVLAGEGVVVVFEVVLSVSAMLLSIRASWPGHNR